MTKEYQEYLESPKWKEFRKKVFERYGRKCDKCQTTKNLQVHHLHYHNIFNEQLEDVRVLCKKHHDEVHGIKQKKTQIIEVRTVKGEQARIDKRRRKAEKRRKKKLAHIIQASKPKKHHKLKKRINPKLPPPWTVLQMKEQRIARQMRVVE